MPPGAPPAVLSDAHRDYLNAHAIADGAIAAAGIWSDRAAIMFPWADNGLLTTQSRIWPEPEGGLPDGTPKYRWEPGHPLHLAAWRPLEGLPPDAPVIVAEGTKQSLAVASWAPPEYAVYGMAGCDGWRDLSAAGLHRFAGHRVIIMLDADAGDNLNVYEAGEGLAAELETEDAIPGFVPSPAWGTDGIDDYLGKIPAGRRAEKLEKLLAKAGPKPSERRPAHRKTGDTLPDTGGLPMVVVNKNRRDVIHEILGCMLGRWNGTALFSFGGALTRLRGTGTEPLDPGSFARWLAETAGTYRYKPPGMASPGSYEAAWPDRETMAALLSSGDEFAPLERISRAPFIRPDGSVCAKQGYDPATGTMLITGNSGMDRLGIPDAPTRADAFRAAWYLLDEWLGPKPELERRGFPWRDEASRANMLALILTPFIRGLVPLVPLAVISGLQMGSGKNLRADCVSLMLSGEAAPPLPWMPDDDEENAKKIHAAFRTGASLFCFDEAHVIGGSAITRAITASTYTDRILGVSKMAAYPNNVTWMALGNQVSTLSDMVRRVYYIELYPPEPDPYNLPEDVFSHPDIRGWTLASRPELVTAALTVIRAWYAAGCPASPRGSLMGSFETWDKMMSGILSWAGVSGFLGNLSERRAERDTTGGYWADHLAWLRGQFGTDRFTCLEVKARALASAGAWDAPPALDEPESRGWTRNLGAAYAKNQDRPFGPYRLVKTGTGHGTKVLWAVRERGEGSDPSIPPTGPVGNSFPSSSSVSLTETIPDLGGMDGMNGSAAGTVNETRSANGGAAKSGTLPDLGVSQPPQTVSWENTKTDEWMDGRDLSSQNVTRERAHAHARLHMGEGGERSLQASDPSRSPAPGNGPVLGFDLETADVRDLFRRERGYRAEDGTGFIRLAGITGAGGNAIVPLPGLLAMLRASGAWYGHNILGFDGPAMAWHAGGPDWRAFWDWFCDGARDTELIARQAFPPRSREKGHSADRLGLDAVAALLGLPGKTDDLKRLAKKHGGYDMIPPGDPEYRAYLDGDLDATRGVAGGLLGHYGRDPYLPREHELARIAGHMSLNGFAVDTGLLERRLQAGEQRKADALQMLHDAWGLPLGRTVLRGRAPNKREEFEPFKSPLATDEGRAWLKTMWDRYQVADAPVTAKTGKLALGVDTLNEVARDPACDGSLRAMIALMNVVTATRTVYQTATDWLCPDGRVHPSVSFRQASGRWSVTEPGLTVYGKHEGRHIERDIYVASPGHVLMSFDLQQVDMRAIAALSQDPAYMELFAPGRDAHSEIAARVFGEMPRDGKGRHPRRQDAKARGHGWNYGMGPDRMIRDGVDPEMAYAFDAGMKSAFGTLCARREEWRAHAKAGGILDNGFGRRMRADPQWAHTVAPALMGQGGARDIMGECLLRLDPALRKYLVGQVHDEIILDVPAADAEEAAAECRRAMTWTWRDVPILCDEAGPAQSWGELSAGK